ncbi:serine/threonine protein kinase, partial [Myxococcota bacterium]|nr:serine/threonine protein kinase [Myxococcota bacterium]
MPADLASIVARAMAPEPADRYPSALELSRDLQAFRTGQLVAARAYSSLDLLRRWLARHRALVAVSALAAVALALVGGMSARRVLAERDLAQAARAV